LNLNPNKMDTALSILAGDICLHVGPEILVICRQLKQNAQSMRTSQDATWVCKDAHFFTLFKTQHGPATLLFSHTNGVLYYASPQAHLAPACPCNTGFLCQFTQDTLPEGLVPRLLAFDVVTMQPMGDRGGFLRAMAQHLPQPLCTVQWVGPSKYLNRDFIERLPHTIKGIMFLGEDPLTVSVCDF